MPATALIKTSVMSGYCELVENLGGDSAQLLKKCHIEPDKITKLEGVISHKAEICALERAACELCCEDFGLRLAEDRGLSMLGPVAAVALTSSKVGDAIDKIIKNLHWFSPAVDLLLLRDTEPGQSILSVEIDKALPHSRQAHEHGLGILRNIMRALVGKDFEPLHVTLASKSPLPPERYKQYFHAELSFDAPLSAFILRTADLHRQITARDRELHQLLDQYTEEILANYSLELEQQIQQLIEHLLPTHNCTLGIVSAQLGFHPRTLQRELFAHGSSFEELLDDSRRSLADQYLAEYEMPLVQVAGLLGYSEQSCLNRACKRWFDCSPTQRRKQLRQ